MSKPDYIVHRSSSLVSRVSDRATGRFLGTVGQYVETGNSFEGLWSAWGPWSGTDGADSPLDYALGDFPERTRHEAVELLYSSEQNCPGALRQKCVRCEPRMYGTPCLNCETQEEAVSRDRLAHPDRWEHYDWLRVQEANSRLIRARTMG